jgi:hypothetical protein
VPFSAAWSVENCSRSFAFAPIPIGSADAVIE